VRRELDPQIDEIARELTYQVSHAEVVSRIILGVSQASGVPVKNIRSRKQNRSTCMARNAAIWIAREATGTTWSELGRMFRRDHTTIRYAYKRFEEFLNKDHTPAKALTLATLERVLERVRKRSK
jgi:chromosomal replication initiation ATPase DnaA